MGRKKNSTVLNKKSTEEKEVVEQEVHINEITATISEENVESEIKKIISKETQTPEEKIEVIVTNTDETPDNINTDETPDNINTDETPDNINTDEEVVPRTLASLSKAEFRFYQRTGIMPK